MMDAVEFLFSMTITSYIIPKKNNLKGLARKYPHRWSLNRALLFLFFLRRRWERFEELLEEARNTRDYDVTLAINQMVDYLLSENGAEIREQLSVQLVDQVDQLGVDAITFARKNVGQVRLRLRRSLI